MLPCPPIKSKNDQNCHVKVHPLYIKYLGIIKEINIFTINIPTFEEWLAMENNGIKFR